jgi:pimeloyl-ACP methyl ester carboxylesterase
MDEFARGVLELLDALDIERTTLGGLSMGGYVTFAALRLAPDRFSALIFANTRASADTDEGRSARDRMLQLVRSKGVGAVADDMLPKLLGQTTRRERPELGDAVRSIIHGNSADAVAGAIEALRDRPDSTPQLAALSVPALVITSDEDTLIPEAEARSMQAQLRRGRLVVLPGAGHLSNLEVPDRFSHALEDFLRAPL